MHRSSETIGALAAALAKAQGELTNPEKFPDGDHPLAVVNGARNLPTCGGPIFPTWAGMVISPRCDRGSRS